MFAPIFFIILLSVAEDTQPGIYISLEELKARYNFEYRNEKITGKQILSGYGKEIVLMPGFSEVMINKQIYYLKAPVKISDWQIQVPVELLRYIVDIELSSSSLDTPKLKVVIDPGHGGKFTGAIEGEAVEKDIVLDISMRLKRSLEEEGYYVICTRTQDLELSQKYYEDLQKRVDIANEEGADIFISLHVNWSKNPLAEGLEVYIARSALPGKNMTSRLLASKIEQEFKNAGLFSRGIKEKDFYVLKWTNCPAVLIELDFISNPQAKEELMKDKHRHFLSQLIKKAIVNFAPYIKKQQ